MLVNRNIEKNVTTVTVVSIARKISIRSAAPSKMLPLDGRLRREAHIAVKRNISFCTKRVMSPGRAMVKREYDAVSPRVLFISVTPATSVFIASLTDEPTKGIIFDVANFNPRNEALSLAAASVPLNAIMASRNENEKTRMAIRFFFNVLVIPAGDRGG